MIEGFGANTTGGLGGTTIWVGNVEELTTALLLNEPRIIRFTNPGNYELVDPIEINNGDLTIDGSDAMICIKIAALQLYASNVIFQNLRLRPGPGYRTALDALYIKDSWNVVVDQCSLSWSVDELFQVVNGGNITLQWCILSEALGNAGHPQGGHSKGPWSMGDVRGLTMHHNLVAHTFDRIPTFTGGQIDLRNHIIYNPGNSRMNFVANYSDLEMNVVKTQYIPGYDSIQKASVSIYEEDNLPSIYLEGNRCPARPTDDLPEEDCIYRNENQLQYLVDTPFAFPEVVTHSIENAYELILNNAGAQPRDLIDARIVQNVRDGTGWIIDDPSQVGGWPDLALVEKDTVRTYFVISPWRYRPNVESEDNEETEFVNDEGSTIAPWTE